MSTELRDPHAESQFQQAVPSLRKDVATKMRADAATVAVRRAVGSAGTPSHAARGMRFGSSALTAASAGITATRSGTSARGGTTSTARSCPSSRATRTAAARATGAPRPRPPLATQSSIGSGAPTTCGVAGRARCGTPHKSAAFRAAAAATGRSARARAASPSTVPASEGRARRPMHNGERPAALIA